MPDYLHTQNEFVLVNNVRIAYRELGANTSALPLLLLNHLGATMDQWDPAFINELARQNHVIVVDLNGVGASGGKVPTTISQMAQEAISFIITLGYDKINLLGLSMGGFIAQDVIRQDPNLVNKLILVGTGPKGGIGIDQVTQVTFKDMAKGQLHHIDPKRYIFYTHDQAGKKEATEVLNRMNSRTKENTDDKMKVSSFLRQLKAIKKWGKDKEDSLQYIHLPTLIINGNDDTMVPTANSYEMHYKIKDSKLVIYPHAGHGSIFQYPNSSVKEIDKFLEN
ncbi:alpha/beta hydrolase [Lactobacillus sp. PV037]|uniref:alpha/beta fold hydrolase n=1 Tax=unclassified Lactobacillus TaxID=2620435 RepID=UPI00223F5109|nr:MULTISPECIES: alpha/beta hydrolase [unclassified Lactobacillus]QNQ82659.1 alpha/beta hydrolase [Lactobacillus sp. PV012]QNQ83225.1 alpha/beta hydrolase [Lactobacillus sp. PV037]